MKQGIHLSVCLVPGLFSMLFCFAHFVVFVFCFFKSDGLEENSKIRQGENSPIPLCTNLKQYICLKRNLNILALGEVLEKTEKKKVYSLIHN